MGAIDLMIDQLLLDSLNPRIENIVTQRDILQAMLDDQGRKLATLAEDIVDNGLSPMDRLLVLREGNSSNRYVVVEGNRRLAALKILANPHSLSDLVVTASLRRRFQKVAERFSRDQVEPIACFEMANRTEANQWIQLRHTGENDGRGVVAWSGLATSRFRGTDPALQALDLVRNYGDLSDEQKRQIDDFPITTLDRLLSSRDVRDLIGVEVVEGTLHSGLPADEVIKPLRRMILDLAGKKINVSQVKNKQQQIEYIKRFDVSDLPDLSKKGTMRPIKDIHGKEFTSTSNTQVRPKRSAPDPSSRKTLVPSKVRLSIQDNKIAAIFKELRGLKLDDNPNAIAVLYRVFLELSVDSYMETKGLDRHYIQPRSNKRQEKTLQQKVQSVVDYLVDQEGCDRKDFMGVVRGLSVDHSPFSIDLLHAYVHNRFVTPKTQDLIGAWDDGQRFFQKIWP